MIERPDERARVVEEALSVLSGKWRPRIIRALYDAGPLGFTDLEARLGDVSAKVLTENLEELREAEIVERTVVTESPLRVEYGLSDAGKDLETILTQLSAWGERHLRRTGPCVLIADADRRLAELYRHWLTPQYAVRHAHDWDELRRQLDGSVDVVVFDRSLPGAVEESSGVFAPSADDGYRIVMVTAERPDLDVVSADCDDIVRKPTSRDALRSAIERQLERNGEPPARREYHALKARRMVLEDTYSKRRLEGSDRFERLERRIEAAAEALEEEHE